MTVDDSLLILDISQYMIVFLYRNDTNEVKGSYHDVCLEKKTKQKKKKKKKKKTTYFAY